MRELRKGGRIPPRGVRSRNLLLHPVRDQGRRLSDERLSVPESELEPVLIPCPVCKKDVGLCYTEGRHYIKPHHVYWFIRCSGSDKEVSESAIRAVYEKDKKARRE